MDNYSVSRIRDKLKNYFFKVEINLRDEFVGKILIDFGGFFSGRKATRRVGDP